MKNQPKIGGLYTCLTKRRWGMIKGIGKPVSFREWASNFSEGFFMMLKLYGDESSVHDKTGQQPRSDFPALSGLIETKEYWEQFARKWKSILDDFPAPYFHFNEFGVEACKQPYNPYHT